MRLTRFSIPKFTIVAAAILTFGSTAQSQTIEPSDWRPELRPSRVDFHTRGVMQHLNKNFYVFDRDGIAAGGGRGNLAYVRAPYQFTGAGGRPDLLAGVAGDYHGRTHSWFMDLSQNRFVHKVGHTRILDYRPQYTRFTASLPANKDVRTVIDIAMTKDSNNETTYTYFDDGTVAIGTPNDLDQYGYLNFTAPVPNLEIVGIAMGTDPFTAQKNVVTAFYSDGTYSTGNIVILDAFSGRQPYIKHGLVKSSYTPSTPPASPITPTPGTAGVVVSHGGSKDMTTAAGDLAVGVAFDASIRFFQRNGQPLSGGVLLSDGTFPIGAALSAYNRNGSEDINQFLEYPLGPGSCAQSVVDRNGKTITTTYQDMLCVSAIRGIYDTRIVYDRQGGRFVIVGQLRNAVRSTFMGGPAHVGDSYGSCSGYWNTHLTIRDAFGQKAGTCIGREYGPMGRGIKFIMVSKSDDPREGFDVWVVAHNDAKDWPTIAVNGDWLIITNRNVGRNNIYGAVAYLVSMNDLRSGADDPEYIRYIREDIPKDDAGNYFMQVEAPLHVGGPRPHSVLLGPGSKRVGGGYKKHLYMVTLAHPQTPYEKRAVHLRDIMPVNTVSHPDIREGIEPGRSVYNGRSLFMAEEVPGAVPGHIDAVVHWVRTAVASNGAVGAQSVSALPAAKGAAYFCPTLTVDDSGTLVMVASKKSSTTDKGFDVVGRLYSGSAYSSVFEKRVWTGVKDTPTYLLPTNAQTLSVDPENGRRIFVTTRVPDQSTDGKVILDSFQ